MHVLFDHQSFSHQRFGGISRYFAEIADRIAASGEARVTCSAGFYLSAFLDEVPHVRVLGWHAPASLSSERARSLLNRACTEAAVRAIRPDVVHETYYREPLLPRKGIRTVITVHDMIPELFPQFFDPRRDATARRKRAAIERADRIVCVSEKTREDMVARYPDAASRIRVIHHGYSPVAPKPERPIARPYVLYVGKRDLYKNFPCLLAAWKLLPPDLRGHALVCFGGGPFLADERRAFAEAGGRPEDLIHVSGEDVELHTHYRHAAAFVLPSLYEGFGLPLLEAFGCGCPVVASRAGSIPEVGGDAVRFFDPKDPASMAEAITDVVTRPSLAADLVARGTARLARFSWDECARDTLAVYRSTL